MKKIKKKIKKKVVKKIFSLKKITGKTKINKVIEINPNAYEILINAGMACVGCAMSSGETLEQGCIAHGLSKDQIEDLIKKLNGESRE